MLLRLRRLPRRIRPGISSRMMALILCGEDCWIDRNYVHHSTIAIVGEV